MDVNINPEVVAKSPFLAGLIGAIIGLRWVPGLTWGSKALNLASGCALAGFFAPGISDWYGLETDSVRSALACAIGVFGLNVIAAVQEAIKTADILSWLPWNRNKTGGE
jgi:hypothetical protein